MYYNTQKSWCKSKEFEIYIIDFEFESGRVFFIRAWDSRDFTHSPELIKCAFQKVRFPRIQYIYIYNCIIIKYQCFLKYIWIDDWIHIKNTIKWSRCIFFFCVFWFLLKKYRHRFLFDFNLYCALTNIITLKFFLKLHYM